MTAGRQASLFEAERPAPDADPAERRRELNRQRQTRWRRRHQFAAPTYDEVDWATVTTCCGNRG